jgi:SAM-dependent methyltransferase
MSNNINSIQFNIQQHNKIAGNYYKRHPEIYNEFEQKRVNDLISYCIWVLDKSQSCNVLDYWSWTWNLTNHFLKLWCNVTALDISQKSLDILSEKYDWSDYSSCLTTVLFDWVISNIPSNTFDCIATYSVLHHVPDYFDAIKEMMRLTKPGWLLVIDHEASQWFWNQSKELKEFYGYKNTIVNKLRKVLYSNEIITTDFWKWIFIRAFIDHRRRNEWDIHVFKDDHIERDTIITFFKEKNRNILKDEKYLLYDEFVAKEVYQKYSKICDDMRCIVFQKPL